MRECSGTPSPLGKSTNKKIGLRKWIEIQKGEGLPIKKTESGIRTKSKCQKPKKKNSHIASWRSSCSTPLSGHTEISWYSNLTIPGHPIRCRNPPESAGQSLGREEKIWFTIFRNETTLTSHPACHEQGKEQSLSLDSSSSSVQKRNITKSQEEEEEKKSQRNHYLSHTHFWFNCLPAPLTSCPAPPPLASG